MSSHQKVTAAAVSEPPSPGSEPLVRSLRSTKIQTRHLDRSAIVYVRQSTPLQAIGTLTRPTTAAAHQGVSAAVHAFVLWRNGDESDMLSG